MILILIPLFYSLLSNNRLFGNPNGTAAFVDYFMGMQIGFFFTLSVLFFSIPITSDEINENVFQLYLTQPASRVTLWGSRYVATVVFTVGFHFLANALYYLYFELIDTSENITKLPEQVISNINIFFIALLLVIIGALIYSAIFVFIGFFTSKSLALGIFIAILETFLAQLLFLSNSDLLPLNHIKNIAGKLFPDTYYTYNAIQNSFIESTLMLVIILAIAIIANLILMVRKEFP